MSSMIHSLDINLYNKKDRAEKMGIKREIYSLQSSFFESQYHHISTTQYQLYRSTTLCRQKTNLIVEEGQDTPLCLNINLGGNFDYVYPQINKNKSSWETNTLNLYSSPNLQNNAYYEEGQKTEQFAIVFSKAFLERQSLSFPRFFEPILNQYETNKCFKGFEENQLCCSQILLSAKQLSSLNWDDSFLPLLLESKVLEFLYLVLREKENTCKKEYCSFEKEKIMEARDILYRQYQSPPTLYQLAHMIGSNELKLKQGFRSLFNNTVYGVLSEYRMQLAGNYLSDTQLSVSEIALLVGFEHHSSFCKAFKAFYGCSPVLFRKKSFPFLK